LFVVLFEHLNLESMAELLFCFWQAWHLRNNVIHGDGKASVHGSARFVASYWESLLRIWHGRDNDKKGKAPIYDMWNRDIAWNGGLANNHQDRRWPLPPYGWAKLNADQEKATLVWWLETDGLVLLTRWRHGVKCTSVEYAEAEACLEGIRLVTKWIKQPTIIESDCLSVAVALNSENESRASFSNIIKKLNLAYC